MDNGFPSISPFIPTSIDYPKAKAKLLRKLLERDGVELSLALAQQLTAKALGHADWHALDQSTKGKLPPSPLSPELGPTEQSLRWCCQRDALLCVATIQPASVPDLLEDWALTGPAKVQVRSEDADVLQAVQQAWPRDEVSIRREVEDSLRSVVCELLEDPKTAELGSLKDVIFVSVLGRLLPAESARRSRTKPKTVDETLREELTSGNADIYDVCRTAIRLLGGRGYGSIAEYELHNKVLAEITKKLYSVALHFAAQRSLWDIVLLNPDQDGLTLFRNTRQALSIPDEELAEADEDDEYSREFADEGALTPFSPEIVTIPVAPDLVVEVMHLPDFNEYGDQFRLTRIEAHLRTSSGDNIGFLNGRLYEASDSDVRRHDFLMVADSQEQVAMEMAEAVTQAYPRVTQCFDYGSFFHVEAIELASIARGGRNSALLLEAVLEHCNDLSECVSALCLDVQPTQLPSLSYGHIPEELRQEYARFNKKLHKRFRDLLTEAPFNEIYTRMLRYCYPDNRVRKI